MKRTVTAMFDSYEDAAEALQRLEAAGIAQNDISLVSNDPQYAGRAGRTEIDDDDDDAADAGKGAGTGAAVGGLLGGGAGLLAGLGMLAIPGLGPVVTAGWLASTLVGLGAGAVTGGIVGALTGAGIDEADAHTYAEGIRRGGTLVTVRVDEMNFDQVLDILDDEGTVNLDERETSWRKEGWSGHYGTETGTGMSGTGTGGAGMRGTGTGGAGMGGTGAGTGGAGASASPGLDSPGLGTSHNPGARAAGSAAEAGRSALAGGARRLDNPGRSRVRAYEYDETNIKTASGGGSGRQ